MSQASCEGHSARGTRVRRCLAVLVAALAVLAGLAPAAAAREQTIRWTHAASDIAGFRVYSSPTPIPGGGSMIAEILLAEAAQSPDGNFFRSIVVPDDAAVYISLTAYSETDVESLRSNQNRLAPPDRDGDGHPDAVDAFPDDPSAWLDSDGDGYADSIDAFPDDPMRFALRSTLRPYRLNAGGSEDYRAADGRVWTRDLGFWNTGVSNTIDPGTAIAGTSAAFDEEIYRSSRTDPESGEEMRFAFPLTNGSYTLRMHFAEHVHAAVGRRVFAVEVEGVRVLQGFDIFAAAGNRRHRAVVRSFSVEVVDGVLEIAFLHQYGYSDPTVMAIEVVSDEALEGEVLTTPGKPFVIDVN